MASIRVCRDKINKQSLGYGYVSRPKWLKRHQIDDLRLIGKHHEHHEPTLRTLRTLRMLRMPSVPCVHARFVMFRPSVRFRSPGLQSEENAEKMHVICTYQSLLLAFFWHTQRCNQMQPVPKKHFFTIFTRAHCLGFMSDCKSARWISTMQMMQRRLSTHWAIPTFTAAVAAWCGVPKLQLFGAWMSSALDSERFHLDWRFDT